MAIDSAILGFAIGDALGVPVEFKTRKYLKEHPVSDMLSFQTNNQPKGSWSDDTSMTLATMDSIIKCQNIDINDMADRFLEWWKKDAYTATGKCFGMGDGTKKALAYWQLNKTQPSGSKNITNNGNGSLMRMVPIAYYLSKRSINEKVKIEIIKRVSSITHAHDISVLGCIIYCKYIDYIIAGVEKNRAYDLVKNDILNLDLPNCFPYYQNEYDRLLNQDIKNLIENNINSSGYVVDTLEAVFWTFLKTNNYQEAVLKAVNLGGDTDTIGALVGALAGIMYGLDDIPLKWLKDLKKENYIKRLCYQFNQIV